MCRLSSWFKLESIRGFGRSLVQCQDGKAATGSQQAAIVDQPGGLVTPRKRPGLLLQGTTRGFTRTSTAREVVRRIIPTTGEGIAPDPEPPGFLGPLFRIIHSDTRPARNPGAGNPTLTLLDPDSIPSRSTRSNGRSIPGAMQSFPGPFVKS